MQLLVHILFVERKRIEFIFLIAYIFFMYELIIKVRCRVEARTS